VRPPASPRVGEPPIEETRRRIRLTLRQVPAGEEQFLLLTLEQWQRRIVLDTVGHPALHSSAIPRRELKPRLAGADFAVQERPARGRHVRKQHSQPL
jgi:hypothetical protein